MLKLKNSILKSLTGLSVNLSATWVALAFITPNFSSLDNPDAVYVLLSDLGFAILFLVLSVILEFFQK